MLAPVLAERTPFKMLGYIGEAVGKGSIEATNEFLSRIAAAKTEGGWVVIGSALKVQMNRDLSGVFTRGRDYIIDGDIWYAADIISERVPGPALVAYFKPAMDLLAPWREDSNRWVRRAVGVGAHFWAKRSRGAPENVSQAEALLSFLEPMFEEWDLDVVKGVGWGLKTLGKHYPELLADWLAQYVIPSQRRHRSLTLRKALTYLSDDQRARALGD
jgi:3-methyladenine DNA glycosylase AlkD